MNKYVKYSTVIASVGAFGIVALEHPHAHIHEIYNVTPVQSGPVIVTSTQSASGGLIVPDPISVNGHRYVS
jgi:hypothetical protein